MLYSQKRRLNDEKRNQENANWRSRYHEKREAMSVEKKAAFKEKKRL